MIHKFFFIGFCLMLVLTGVSIYSYITTFEQVKGVFHLSVLSSIGLNVMWSAFFFYMYWTNRPQITKKDINDIQGMIKDFDIMEVKE